MKCNVCGSPGNRCEQEERSCRFFHNYLDEGLFQGMKVPCYVRKQLNGMVGKLFVVLDQHQEEFVFKLKKGLNKSYIYGSDYQRFLDKFDVLSGDRIRVELDHPPPYFHVRAETVADSPMSSEDQPGAESDDEGSDNEDIDTEATVTVFTNGLQLTGAQTATMNDRVLMRGIGMGPLFVHKLTQSDIKQNGLKIVSSLNTGKSGWAVLVMGDSDTHYDAEYFKSSDGRIRFRSGWADFADHFDLEEGSVVLVMFHMDTNGRVGVVIK
ncbi:unnamed protein product [Alopecurus aequalis]